MRSVPDSRGFFYSFNVHVERRAAFARPLERDVGRSRYAEESRTSAARTILHLHALNPEGVILQYFVRINQHEEECRRAL